MLLSRVLRYLAVSVFACQATAAFALIDAELLVGKRWYTLSTPTKVHVASQEVALAAHVDPIPLVPVSFGVKVASGMLDKKDLQSATQATSIGTGSMFQAGLDFMAWVPLVPIVTPYVRLDVPLYGMWKVSGTNTGAGTSYSETARVIGAQLSVGIKYSPLPLTSILLEVNRAAENYKESEVSLNGVKQEADSKVRTLNSNAIFLGVEVGL